MLMRLLRMSRYIRARIHEHRADRAVRRGAAHAAEHHEKKAEEIFRSLDAMEPVEPGGARGKAEARVR